MHFPELKRRASYRISRGGGYYADYREYFGEVAEDCLHRCVYCDARLEEIGGEGMHLDHFRPQSVFPHLARDPNNLVLSCARCNQLKSDRWPSPGHHCCSGNVGFIDPFDPNKLDLFEVVGSGAIIPKLPPASYVVELLCLNRASRVVLRRRRLYKSRLLMLLDDVVNEITSLSDDLSDRAVERLRLLAASVRDVKSLISQI
jgi:uncharacterized protein (TIGR02646 family)